MTAPASITPAALAHLRGRPVVLRSSPRHGCCGGTALLPAVEIGPPDDAGAFVRTEVSGAEVFVDPRLDDVTWWTIDVDGLLRWRRLVVRDAEPAELAGHRSSTSPRVDASTTAGLTRSSSSRSPGPRS